MNNNFDAQEDMILKYLKWHEGLWKFYCEDTWYNFDNLTKWKNYLVIGIDMLKEYIDTCKESNISVMGTDSFLQTSLTNLRHQHNEVNSLLAGKETAEIFVKSIFGITIKEFENLKPLFRFRRDLAYEESQIIKKFESCTGKIDEQYLYAEREKQQLLEQLFLKYKEKEVEIIKGYNNYTPMLDRKIELARSNIRILDEMCLMKRRENNIK